MTDKQKVLKLRKSAKLCRFFPWSGYFIAIRSRYSMGGWKWIGRACQSPDSAWATALIDLRESRRESRYKNRYKNIKSED